jgi:hypothetical protein
VDLPARALSALLLVLTVTIAADALGPTLSGQLAAFPVLTSVLLVFTHLTRGAVEVQLLTRAFLLGLHGFALFSLLLALTLDELNTGVSFALATVAAIATADDDRARAPARQRARSTPATCSASSIVEHTWRGRAGRRGLR